MKQHKKKIAAAIACAACVILYFIVYFGFLITLPIGFWRYVLGILPIGFIAIMIAVCIERIKEIKKGEEDDLSQY